MSILIDESTSVLVQGVTGRMGREELRRMQEFGTRVVAGAVPGKDGEEVRGVPVYDSVADAVRDHRIDASIIFVPPQGAKAAALEAIGEGIPLVCISTEWMPFHDIWHVHWAAKKAGTLILGPNSMGVASPGRARLGGVGGDRYQEVLMPGPVGIASRSGGMAGEIAWNLTRAGIGQSTVVSLGGDQLLGISFRECIERFDKDPATRVIVVFGEVGTLYEEEAASFLLDVGVTKPVIALIGGHFSEGYKGVQFGHGGAVIQGGRGTPSAKIAMLEHAGAHVVMTLDDVVERARAALVMTA